VLIMLTSIARINEWEALRSLNAKILLEKARELGTVRYRIYSNMYNASQGCSSLISLIDMQRGS
jgi:hypothetical protein